MPRAGAVCLPEGVPAHFSHLRRLVPELSIYKPLQWEIDIFDRLYHLSLVFPIQVCLYWLRSLVAGSLPERECAA